MNDRIPDAIQALAGELERMRSVLVPMRHTVRLASQRTDHAERVANELIDAAIEEDLQDEGLGVVESPDADVIGAATDAVAKLAQELETVRALALAQIGDELLDGGPTAAGFELAREAFGRAERLNEALRRLLSDTSSN